MHDEGELEMASTNRDSPKANSYWFHCNKLDFGQPFLLLYYPRALQFPNIGKPVVVNHYQQYHFWATASNGIHRLRQGKIRSTVTNIMLTVNLISVTTWNLLGNYILLVLPFGMQQTNNRLICKKIWMSREKASRPFRNARNPKTVTVSTSIKVWQSTNSYLGSCIIRLFCLTFMAHYLELLYLSKLGDDSTNGYTEVILNILSSSALVHPK